MILTYSRVFKSIAWFCVALLAVLSLIPSNLEIRSGMPGGVEHAMAYFGTAIMLMLGYPRKAWSITAGLVVYGGLLEMLQLLAPGRTPKVADAIASGAGAILGVIAGAVLLDYWRKAASRHYENELMKEP